MQALSAPEFLLCGGFYVLYAHAVLMAAQSGGKSLPR